MSEEIEDIADHELAHAVEIGHVSGITATQCHDGTFVLPPEWGSNEEAAELTDWLHIDTIPLYYNRANGSYDPAPPRYLHGSAARGKLYLYVADYLLPSSGEQPDASIPDMSDDDTGLERGTVDGSTLSGDSPGSARGCILVPGSLAERDAYLRHGGQWRDDLEWVLLDELILPWYEPAGYHGQQGVFYYFWGCITCGRLFVVLQHFVEGVAANAWLAAGPWELDGSQPWHPPDDSGDTIPDMPDDIPSTCICIGSLHGMAVEQDYAGEHLIFPTCGQPTGAVPDVHAATWRGVVPDHTVDMRATLDPETWAYSLKATLATP